MDLCFKGISSKGHTATQNKHKQRSAVEIARLSSWRGSPRAPPAPAAGPSGSEGVVQAVKTGDLFTLGSDLLRNGDFYVAK